MASPGTSTVSSGGLCIAGESLIDMLPRQTADGAAAYLPCPGGSPFNALLAASRLGMPVKYLASLSTDMFGEQLHGLLEKEGVNLDLVTRVDRPTTLAFVSREPGKGEKYAFFKENSADRALDKACVRQALESHRFDAVHVSLGAVTLEDAQMKEAFEELLRTSGQQGALRTFDPNLRSNMIRSGAASYRDLIENFLQEVDIVKCSDDDLEFLYNTQNFEQVAKTWLGMVKGPKLVVVTQGGNGATTYYPTKSNGGQVGSFHTTPPCKQPNTIDASGAEAPLVDTVGAGDTFMGGVIQGFLSDARFRACSDPPLKAALSTAEWGESALRHLENLMERAATCAAINCSRAGCDPPSCEEAEAA
eukprot:CAMPEP_0172671886 /NCGR_PEP_ID=MMETSP1074-20121228/11200_1 /TAXON_ID=2916 /ORGANISM="Ceratium fusus, Strain PA161109" /LENGTH=361 /DNA_ID=CAMNT_0013488999 /DNA_START=67 /DNA_END=1149 /DNA_ORIENTATION=+